jgi:putative FmdB family regulatory protein
MPIYIYRCKNCGVQFERHQSFTDEPLKRCPECNKNSLRKVLTPAGIVFKGSGWYATDHKSASGAPRQLKTENKDSGSGKTESASSPTSESAGSSDSSTTSSTSGSSDASASTPSSKSDSAQKSSE